MSLMWFVDKFYNKKPTVRWWISRIMFGNRNTKVNLFDLKINIHTIKESGYLRASNMCRKGSLLRDEVSILLNLSALLKDGDSFVDIGANVGIFSSVLSRYKKVFENLRVYSFEANPDTYKRLNRNAERYEFESFNCAISDQEGELEFVYGTASHVFTTMENSSKYHYKDRSIRVSCKRLDQFNFDGDSLILKIDVEGQELNVLRGAKSLFDEKRIKAVYLDGFSEKNKVLDFLKSYDFTLLNGRSLAPTDGNTFSLLAVAENI
ncbi:MAG: FkbM family methyltransferase [Elainellaceae cyanobacterium]